MKSIFGTSCCFLLLLIASACGKKAQENDPLQDKMVLPTMGELYFNAFTDINEAVNANDIDKLEKALRDNPGVDLNTIQTDGDTFLIRAIRRDFRPIRNLLLDKNCNPNQPNIDGSTPLIVAAKENRANSVRVLLDYKVNVNAKNKKGETALHAALMGGFEDIALMLLNDKNTNLSLTAKDGKTPYEMAMASNLLNAAELIRVRSLPLELGAPDILSYRSMIMQGDMETIALFVNRYPRITTDYDIINPLALLLDNKDEERAFGLAQFLINKKSNINGPENAETTPLIRATLLQKRNFATLFLEEGKANPQLLDKEGKSALIHAIENNNLELVELLLYHSAVENYTFRKDGKKITYDSCKVAKNTSKTLTTSEAKNINKEIQHRLDCGFLSWLFR